MSRQSGNVSIDSDENLYEIKDASDTPEKAFEKKELQKTVHRAISVLPQKYREVIMDEPFRQALLLRSVYQLSYERIAAETETDIGTVKSRISRARNALKEILKKDGTFSRHETSN